MNTLTQNILNSASSLSFLPEQASMQSCITDKTYGSKPGTLSGKQDASYNPRFIVGTIQPNLWHK